MLVQIPVDVFASNITLLRHPVPILVSTFTLFRYHVYKVKPVSTFTLFSHPVPILASRHYWVRTDGQHRQQ